MSYARQDTTMKRLQLEALSKLDETRKLTAGRLQQLWQSHKLGLAGAITSAYRMAAPSEKWNSVGFGRVRPRLAKDIRSILQQFHAMSVPLVKKSVKGLRDQSALRHAWALDQVTPENFKVMIPEKLLKESDVLDDSGMFEERWSSWLEAYNSALFHNLNLNAINQGSMSDAVDEIDATKANTPAYTLIDALNRIYDYEAMAAISDGANEVGALNEDAIEEEVWRTRGDLRVCDDCDANEGQTIDDVGFPPLHPNCHCFTELVPTSFAELLRSGDSDDNELAANMQRDGVVPNALVIRGADGQIAAKSVVDFNSWSKDQGYSIVGR